MKRYLAFYLLLSMSMFSAASAQVVSEESVFKPVSQQDARQSSPTLSDSLYAVPCLPALSLSAPGFYGLTPWSYAADGLSWRLHEGFNAQLSMSLSIGLGKGSPSGVGFGQSAVFAYALPLSKRFSVAAGVYADNMDWGGFRSTDGGVAAAVQYRLSDVVSLYAYGTKSFLPKKNRFLYAPGPYYSGFYGLPVPTDRIGAMAEFKIGKNAMIQVSVEKQDY